jgi:hypothetical protein
MKIISLLLFISIACAANAQYYYKDIVGTRETAEMVRNYRANKVSRVVLNSYDAENTRSDDFFVEQVFSPSSERLVTTTRSGITAASVLTAFVDEKGNVFQTIDSTEISKSTTTYQYNSDGLLLSVVSKSNDTANSGSGTEAHYWEYKEGRVARMLRVKDGKDTTYVNFKWDDRGNITEEQGVRRGVALDPVYYYYDSNNRLTDIVRFHNKAKRLLPEYMFEYSPSNQVIQKITVPSNSSEYLIWRYQYDNRGLKIREAVFDKHKQLTGKVEYQYQFGG